MAISLPGKILFEDEGPAVRIFRLESDIVEGTPGIQGHGHETLFQVAQINFHQREAGVRERRHVMALFKAKPLQSMHPAIDPPVERTIGQALPVIHAGDLLRIFAGRSGKRLAQGHFHMPSFAGRRLGK